MVPGAAEMQLTIAQLIQDLFKKSKTLFALIRTFGLFHLGGNTEEKLWTKTTRSSGQFRRGFRGCILSLNPIVVLYLASAWA